MFQYIDTAQALTDYLASTAHADWVILDTEFIRERTYFPKLCLIQLATADTLACIDPLAIEDLSTLFSWLQRPEMVKVFHAAWQDLEIFHYLSGSVPTPIFDSQIAAAVLGIGDQMGYARLVENMLGIQLDKSQSRTDWSRRPLKQKQLEYAIDDVRYLRDLYPMLLDQLEKTGRAAWLDKSFQHLGDATAYEPSPRDCWKRTKGVQLLKPKQLSALRELTAWREEQAIKKDLPRRWLVADEVLADMARMKIITLDDFSTIRGLKPEQVKRHGETWLQLIQTGLNLPPEEWPELPRRRKPDADMALVTDLLMLVVNKQARASNISPQMIATRSQVEKMLTEGRKKLSDDWRGSLMNDVFADILHGKSTLGVENLKVVLEKTPKQ